MKKKSKKKFEKSRRTQEIQNYLVNLKKKPKLKFKLPNLKKTRFTNTFFFKKSPVHLPSESIGGGPLTTQDKGRNGQTKIILYSIGMTVKRY